MSLTLADKIALIYTSAGSQRKVAEFIGVSHQTVGRILHAQAQGKSIAAYEKRADLSHQIDAALDLHRDLVRTVAAQHKIPYSEAVPIYSERMPLQMRAVTVGDKIVFKGDPAEVKKYLAGKLVVRRDERGEVKSAHKIKPQHVGRATEKLIRGARVNAKHLHWVSDALRDKWLAAQQRSGRFISASVGSVVNRRTYNRQANERAKSSPRRRTVEAAKYAEELAASNQAAVRIYTPYTAMDKNHSTAAVIADINSKLQTRHAPAVGQTGTVFADSILLQLDTRPQNEAKQTQAPRNRRATGRSRAKK